MPFTMDDLFKKDVWLPGGDVVEGAIAERGADPVQQAPRGADPGPQAPREVDVPPRSAPIVPAARTAPRQAPAQDAGGQTFDVRRALSSLFGGQGAVSDYDRQRLAEMSARAKAKTDEEEMGFKRRKDTREQEAHDALVPKKAAKLDAEARGVGLKNDALDSTSESSKKAVSMMADRVEARIASLPDGEQKDLARRFVQNARAPGAAINVLQAQEWAKRLGADVHDIMSEAQKSRAQDETETMGAAKRADMLADNAREDKKLEMRRTAAAAKANAVAQKVHLTGDQHKLVAEIADGMMNGNEIDELLPIAEKYAREASDIPGMGKTGRISGVVQQMKSGVNATSDPEYNKFASALARLYSVERKTFAGVAVTDREMENLRPFMPDLKKDSEATVRDKLRDGRRKLDEMLKVRMSQLNYDAKGNPIDPSLIARLLSDVAPDSAAANKQIAKMRGGKPAPPIPGQSAPPAAQPPAEQGAVAAPRPWPGAKTGERRPDKKTGIVWEMQADGTLKKVN